MTLSPMRVLFVIGMAGVAAMLHLQPDVSAQTRSLPAVREISIASALNGDTQRWQAQVTRLQADGTLRRRTAYADPLQPTRTVEALTQYYQGVPVLGAGVSRIFDGTAVVAISGRIIEGLNVDTTPTLTASDAASRIERLAASPLAPGGRASLVIARTLDGRFVLAYRAMTANARTWLIDADTGETIGVEHEQRTQSAVGTGIGALGDRKKVSATRRSNGYVTWDVLRPAEILTLDTRNLDSAFERLRTGGGAFEPDLSSDADNTWTSAAIVDAHTHTGWAYDYYYSRHRHQGVNGQNGRIYAVVNTNHLLLNNAFFTPVGPAGTGGFFYGATTNGTPFTPLDIVGHEFTHGVTEALLSRRTGSGLDDSYVLELGPTGCGSPFWCSGGRFLLTSNHGGATHEALSDIFGAATEFWAYPAGTGPFRADYVIGEDLGEPRFERSLDDPARYEVVNGIRYPDHVNTRLLFPIIFTGAGPFRCGSSNCDLYPAAYVNGGFITLASYANGLGLRQTDFGGVHMNLTVLGHAFYLAIEGGRNRTSGVTVQGVGSSNREQVERVFFIAVRDLIPSVSSFDDIAAALRQAAGVTYGASAAVTRAIDQALTAVGL